MLENSVHLPTRVLLGILLWCSLAVPAPAGEAPTLADALGTLGAEEYAEELAWWADDERAGREPGTPGSIQASERAAEQFHHLGLEAAGDRFNGGRIYQQYLDRGGMRGLLPGSVLAVGSRRFEHGNDWSLLGGCDSTDLEGLGVVFVGYGIEAPEYDYDDYAGIDVTGKFVLMLRYEPREKDPESPWEGSTNTRHAYFQTKLRAAKQRGAVAVLLVNGPLHHDPAADPLSDLSTVVGVNESVPMVHVGQSVADAILESSGVSLRKLQETIDEQGKPASRILQDVRVDLRAKVAEVSKARNVIALLRGSDPALRDELVVVGAHYDHVGLGRYGARDPSRIGEIHNGADDNASGSLGVIEVAEALVEAGLRPRRSILFQLYDAEEKGLLGSGYYVAHPTFPNENVVAMINLDMIGRVKNGRCSVIGTGTAKEFQEILDAAQEGVPLQLDRSEGSGGGSDHVSFVRSGIPALFFFTGMHQEYHTPDDDADRCNAEGAVEILRLVTRVVWDIANRDARLTFQKPPERGRVRGALLGVQTESSEEGVGVPIRTVVEGGGADKAGLRAGDVLLAVDGIEVNDLAALRKMLGEHKPGDTVKVRFRRGEKVDTADVTLGGWSLQR